VRIIAACILVLMLAGCSDVWSHRPDCIFGIADGYDCSPGTVGYSQAQARQQQAVAMSASDDAQCRSYGAAPGSPSYIQCRTNLDNQRAQMRTAIASQVAGNMMARPQQPQTYNVNVCNVPGQVNTCMYPH
jgi:hypothetical protein